MTAPSMASFLRRRLLWSMLLPGLVLVLGLALLLARWQEDSLERQQYFTASGMSRYVEIYVEAGVSGLRHLALSLRMSDSYRRGLELKAFIDSYPHFEHVVLLDDKGRVAAVMPEDSDFDLSVAVLGAAQPEPGSLSMVSPPLVSPQSGNVVVYLVVETPDHGYVVGVFSLKALRESISKYAHSDIGMPILADRYGNLIVHPDESRVERQENIGNMDILIQGRWGETGAMYFQDNGRWFLGTARFIPDLGWVLILAKPGKDVFLPIAGSLLLLTLGVVALYGLIALALGRMMRNNVTVPLQGFTSAMEQVGRGEYQAADSGVFPFMELQRIGESFQAMARRISEREEDLRKAEEKYRDIFENSVHGIVRTTPSGQIQEANPAMARMFGFASVREMRASIWDAPNQMWADAEDRSRMASTLAQGREIKNQEVKLKRWDGGIWWGLVSAWPYLDEHGSLFLVEAMIQDISDHKAAEEALYRSRALLMESQRVSGTGGWELDLVRDKVYWTDEEYRIYGLDPNETKIDHAMFLENLVHPEDKDKVQRSLERVRATGVPDALEYRIIRADGQVRVLKGVAVPDLDGTGVPRRVYGATRDVTEEKAAEQALIQARDEAREALRVKSEFLANMSHELRTPLAGIFGMLRLALDSELSEEQRGWLQIALNTGTGLMTVINDVLDFSKMDAGTLTILREPFRFREALTVVMENFKVPARDKGLELALAVSPDLPEVLVGDEARLRQVLFNLVGNAVKFTDQGGVRVSVDVLPEARPGMCNLLLIVADTGIGIDPQAVDVLFTAFTQAEGAYNRRYQGTGLGLSIVKRLVRLMGGGLAVDSDVGQGTTVYWSMSLGLPPSGKAKALPAADAAPAPEPLPAELETPCMKGRPSDLPLIRPMHILIAEDEPVNRIAVRRFLESLGHHVTVAEDGAKALDKLSQGGFHCAIMDVQMPEVDGLTVVRQLRAGQIEGADPDLPVIALTAHISDSHREAALRAGMDAYLVKPVELEELAAALAQVDRRGQ